MARTSTAVRLKDYTEEFFGEGKTLTTDKREQLILKYAPLVNYVASKLAGRLPPHILQEDLIGPGIIGLIDAVEKFDPNKKIKFKTYAEFRIRGTMLDELRQLDWIPRSVRKKAAEIEKAREKLEKKLERIPEDEEIAKELGLSLPQYYKLLDKAKGVTFLDIETIRRWMPDANDEDLFDLIADDNGSDPFECFNLTEVKEIVVKAIKTLPEKEKLVVSLYYFEELTMREIGEIMGYTESRISQMHTKAVLRIRSYLSEKFTREEISEFKAILL